MTPIDTYRIEGHEGRAVGKEDHFYNTLCPDKLQSLA
uniref:Uncharacterized protein n=1 Tax=Rhizophora mucronata TaxID=61149 RepID=A0A2P2PNU2_RHIMU